MWGYGWTAAWGEGDERLSDKGHKETQIWCTCITNVLGRVWFAWIEPTESTGTSVSAWLSVWFWLRMESLTRHSVWTPSPVPPILTRDCTIEPAIIFEAPPSPWIWKLNVLTASPPKRFQTEAFRPSSSTEGRIFEARVNVRSRVTRLTNARPILSLSHAEFQCCCFPMTCPGGHFAFNLINIEIWGESGDTIKPLASKIPPSVRIASQQAAQVRFSVYVCACLDSFSVKSADSLFRQVLWIRWLCKKKQRNKVCSRHVQHWNSGVEGGVIAKTSLVKYCGLLAGFNMPFHYSSRSLHHSQMVMQKDTLSGYKTHSRLCLKPKWIRRNSTLTNLASSWEGLNYAL